MNSFWTINGTNNEKLEGRIWQNLAQVTEAWIDLGSPVAAGSSVWATEHAGNGGVDTLQTVTLA